MRANRKAPSEGRVEADGEGAARCRVETREDSVDRCHVKTHRCRHTSPPKTKRPHCRVAAGGRPGSKGRSMPDTEWRPKEVEFEPQCMADGGWGMQRPIERRRRLKADAQNGGLRLLLNTDRRRRSLAVQLLHQKCICALTGKEQARVLTQSPCMCARACERVRNERI